ncbi:MAG: hypothetical protein OEQ18_06605, partial [Gammaproteobacteria bacterium]|nr:hypothetical protein [Gammaproteobacteria bacterium]
MIAKSQATLVNDVRAANQGIVRRYYLSMLSLAVIVLVVGILSAMLTEAMMWHLRDAIVNLVLVFVVVNLIGVYMMFGPIRRFMTDQEGFGHAERRIGKLPLMSAVWAFGLTLAGMLPHHYATHVLCSDCPADLPLKLVLYPPVLIVVHGGFLSLYIYFLISDYTVALRTRLTSQYGVVFKPGGERFLYKLLIAFAATSIVPIVLVFAHDFMMRDATVLPVAPAPDGMHHVQMPAILAYRVDIIFAMVLAGLAIVFISRSLTKPMNMLLATMKRVSQGDL